MYTSKPLIALFFTFQLYSRASLYRYLKREKDKENRINFARNCNNFHGSCIFLVFSRKYFVICTDFASKMPKFLIIFTKLTLYGPKRSSQRVALKKDKNLQTPSIGWWFKLFPFSIKIFFLVRDLVVTRETTKSSKFSWTQDKTIDTLILLTVNKNHGIKIKKIPYSSSSVGSFPTDSFFRLSSVSLLGRK